MSADANVQAKNYQGPGGDNWHVAGTLTIEPGGQILDANGVRANGFTFTPAAGSANVSLVTLQVTDGNGNSVAGVFNFDIWLSDAATGAGLTATTASGAVGAGASGADFGDYTAKKAKRVQTDATGKYILSITDTAKTGFYVAAQTPGSRRAAVSAQLITANYG
jgi:hypothetical protein